MMSDELRDKPRSGKIYKINKISRSAEREQEKKKERGAKNFDSFFSFD